MPCLKPVGKKAVILILDASAVFLLIVWLAPAKEVRADESSFLETNSLPGRNSVHNQRDALTIDSLFSPAGSIDNATNERLGQGISRSLYFSSIQKPWEPNRFSTDRLFLPKLGEKMPWQQEKPKEIHPQETKRDTWRGRPLHELPVIIEPMMFDLIRPLHSQKGEWEFNTLGFFPVHPQTEFAWEPEFEYAIGDGFAVELELPGVNDELEFIKFTTQYTLGTGLNNKLIHAVQGIYEYGLDGGVSVPTGLWIVGLRLSETWSFIGMSGARSFISPAEGRQRTELLQNLALYADINPAWNVGIEANIEQDISGPTNTVLMPQAHWDVTDLIELKIGMGVEIAADRTVPLAAFRVVYSPY